MSMHSIDWKHIYNMFNAILLQKQLLNMSMHHLSTEFLKATILHMFQTFNLIPTSQVMQRNLYNMHICIDCNATAIRPPKWRYFKQFFFYVMFFFY